MLSACNISSGRSSLTKRAEPSAKVKLAPPGWPLPKAHVRQSGSVFGYGVGDIDLDGDIDGDDYFWIDSNIGAQGLPL